jgi:pyruvate/2-oxoglutarate dehydrogenase complex dihydrolipoamide acyltransferase (E2) component
MRWLIQVKKAEVIADIETEKATMELGELIMNGTLLYLLAAEERVRRCLVNRLCCVLFGEKGKVECRCHR